MLIGYARVSTQDQNLELQLEALRQAGCQKVFEDQVSGTRAERPGLAKAREMLREGDTLVVWNPLRQNSCRSHRTQKLGAVMGYQIGKVRTNIQRQGSCKIAATRERLARSRRTRVWREPRYAGEVARGGPVAAS